MKNNSSKSFSKDALETSVEIKLQVYLNAKKASSGQWQDACILRFANPAEGRIGSAQLEYQPR